MTKIGIMGGTFDPIHLGHLALAEEAFQFIPLDFVLFIPTGISYRKKDVTDAVHRKNMCELAIRNTPYFYLSEIEINKKGNTYTYETLQDLKRQYENSELFFIIGADSLFSIETWKCPDLIFQECTLLVATRDEYNKEAMLQKIDDLKQRFHAKIILFFTKNITISSTEIREIQKTSGMIQDMVPKEVMEYIQEQNLYK